MGEILKPETIIYRYGLQYHPQFSCQHNGVINALRIAMKDPETDPFPRLFEVQFPQDVHVYPVFKNCVLNGGVTAAMEKYPDFSLPDLLQKGVDQTEVFLSAAIWAYLDSDGNPISYNKNRANVK